MRCFLRKAGYRYKRMRLSLKDKRDQLMFEFFKQELIHLKAMEDKKEIDLFFFDEMGVNLTPKVCYGWQPIGQTACWPSSRSQNLTTLGFVNRDVKFHSFVFHGAANTEMVIACMNEFVDTLQRKTVLIMDNAPIHTSKLFLQHIPEWKQKGLHIQFIPPYCPELNYIERLWKHIKYHCLPIEAFYDLNSLEYHLNDVLENIGKKYQFNFN